jgi:hypothetical protein
MTAAAAVCGRHCFGQLDSAAQVGSGKYGGVFLYGPVDPSGAGLVVKLVDIANEEAVWRLCWEADMLERARQEGGLLGSVLPDVVGLHYDEQVRPQTPVDPTVWRRGGVRPMYHACLAAVRGSPCESEESSQSLVPDALCGYLCHHDLDRWQAL